MMQLTHTHSQSGNTLNFLILVSVPVYNCTIYDKEYKNKTENPANVIN